MTEQAAAIEQSPPPDPPTQSGSDDLESLPQSNHSTQPAAVANDPLRRSPFLATILSVMPGLGQVYVGYYQRGFIHAVVVATLIALLASQDLGPLIPLGSVFLAFFWLYNIVDAGRRAVLYNQALAGRANFELPQDFTAPGLRGTVMGGAVLVAVGLVLLSRTLFGVSLEWLEDWWPLAIVAFGAYLMYKAMQDRGGPAAASSDED